MSPGSLPGHARSGITSRTVTRLTLQSAGLPIFALGEAKHTESRRTLSDLSRLERIRELVAAKNPSAAKARLMLFSANGFEANRTRESARRDDIELIDATRLYVGA
jgi:uncharacterized protein